VIEHLFGAVPDRFAQIVNTIQQWGDLATISVSEAVGRLASSEESQRGRRRSGGDKDEQLMLVTRALESLMKGKKTGDGSGGSSSGSKKKPSGDRGGDKKTNGRKEKHRKFVITKVRCYNCNVTGHFQSDCTEPKRERANLTQKQEDDEPALLMAETCELIQITEETGELVILHEEKVQPKLSGDREMSWYLDTGASNHMTASEEKFSELNRSVHGTVKFGDASTVEIKGRGSVIFDTSSGEHKVLTEVYFIPKLRSNIISLGQLDEIGCKYSAENGVMEVLDRDRKLLARVPCGCVC
jgi:hypothetical protein